jgi:hypothetical protein
LVGFAMCLAGAREAAFDAELTHGGTPSTTRRDTRGNEERRSFLADAGAMPVIRPLRRAD